MSELRRILIKVAYDGTAYHGWQYQPEEITVEGKINEALSELCGESIEVIGASRTDAGVHSLGSIAVFDTHCTIPAERLPYALNPKLPEDIRLVEAFQVDNEFHPRRCEMKKTYSYRILNTRFQDPIKRLYTYWVSYPLEVDAMRSAAKYLIGEHDFTSFCSVNSQSETKVRTISDISVSKNDDEILISVTGNGFLYNMVRIIAGTLIDVGRGHISPDSVEGMLAARDREAAGPTAPPQGLVLVGYEYNWERIKKI